ncbi:MAG: EamA family transporter, partial [Thioclava sp.]|nr:EamA family transporter [Thioclava sp.]
MTRGKATSIGFSAVLLWALLALLTVGSAPVPPLLLNALCFAVGGVIGVIWLIATGTLGQLREVSWKVYAAGTAGLFGYHLFYFSALRLAPPAEAGLIAYLWPLLIVLFSGLLPGERLTIWHIAGAAMAFLGAALILGGGLSADPSALPGYALALVCALTWSSYSLLSRRFGSVPTAAVAVYCLATSVLSGLAHLVLEPTVWPENALGWASVLALGLGPVGLLFDGTAGPAILTAAICSILALVLMTSGQGQAAVPVWERVLELRPDDADIWHNYAKLLGDLKRYEKSQQAFQRALALQPGRPPTLTAYARMLAAAEQYEAAEKIWLELLARFPQQAEVHLSLGQVRFAMGNLEAAMETFRQGLDAVPDSADLHMA